MKCPKCNHIIEEYYPFCKNCDYIFKSVEYDGFISDYIEKYSKIPLKYNDTENNNAKIIFKNILVEDENLKLFNNISAEDFTIEYYKQKGYNAFLAENIYWFVLLGFIYFPEQMGEIIWGYSFPRNLHHILNDLMKEVDINSIDNIPNLNNRIIKSFFEYFQTITARTHRTEYLYKYPNIGDNFTIDDLIISINYFGNTRLKLIFKRIMDDSNHYIYGLPDLIVYNDKEIFFVEVKSKNDVPKFNQIQWHKFLSEIIGINVVVFMIDKTEKQIISIKHEYDIELFDSKNRAISIEKSYSEESIINWDNIDIKYSNFQIDDDEFRYFYRNYDIHKNLLLKEIGGECTLFSRKYFKNSEEWWKYTEFINDDLRYQNAPKLYQDTTFMDYRPNKKQLKRNKDAKLLEEKGEYPKAIDLYMKNVEEKCGSPITYKSLIDILTKHDKWYDIVKLMDFAIPIFLKLNDKKNTLYFIHKRQQASLRIRYPIN